MDATDRITTLAVTLREGDSGTIDQDVEVFVAKMTLGRVKLAFRAPLSRRISRKPKHKPGTKMKPKGGP